MEIKRGGPKVIGKIHAGKRVKLGGRYDRVLGLLRVRGSIGASSFEIQVEARVCSASTVISELRAMGLRFRDAAEKGTHAKRYWIEETRTSAGELFANRSG